MTIISVKSFLKPRANGSNRVGQQLPTLLDVTCCVRFHTLLHVVAQSLKPVKLLAACKRTQQLPPLLANNIGSVASVWTQLKRDKYLVSCVFTEKCSWTYV